MGEAEFSIMDLSAILSPEKYDCSLSASLPSATDISLGALLADDPLQDSRGRKTPHLSYYKFDVGHTFILFTNGIYEGSWFNSVFPDAFGLSQDSQGH